MPEMVAVTQTSAANAPAGQLGATDLGTAARRLFADMMDRPWGQLSPSVYETARLVALAPWLRGHDERLRFLVASQRPDGRWGHLDGYGVVPTLSAVEAALTVLLRRAETPPELRSALDRGLVTLFGWLREPAPLALPDTPAIEIIVPALVGAVNAHLARVRRESIPGLDRWTAAGPLRLPPGLSDAPISALRSLLDTAALPTKLLHSVEVAAPLPAAVRSWAPTPPGTVGASPAATAAWLAARAPHARGDAAVSYLEALADEHGGAVPSVVPITTFERAWVLSWLAGTGTPAPAELVASLAGSLGDVGTSGGGGLPPDADTTSVVLAVLERQGGEPDLDCLLGYHAGTHFCTWPGERTASVSTNAHVLDALGARLVRRPQQAGRYGAYRRQVVAWLCEQQLCDGNWTDKWHASPFYATACCALALTRFGGAAAEAAVARAVRWLLCTQRADGSWGRWSATREETAYALHVLTLVSNRTPSRQRSRVAEAMARGRSHLLSAFDIDDEPPLWHDKDLYHPTAVVHASILAALHHTRRAAGHTWTPQPR